MPEKMGRQLSHKAYCEDNDVEGKIRRVCWKYNFIRKDLTISLQSKCLANQDTSNPR